MAVDNIICHSTDNTSVFMVAIRTVDMQFFFNTTDILPLLSLQQVACFAVRMLIYFAESLFFQSDCREDQSICGGKCYHAGHEPQKLPEY
jgi:hypothetical protein